MDFKTRRVIADLKDRIATLEGQGQARASRRNVVRSNGLFSRLRGSAQQEYDVEFIHKRDADWNIIPLASIKATSKARAVKKWKQYLKDYLASSGDGYRGETDVSQYSINVFRVDEE